MAEKFTAEMARAAMPDESKFEELVADCHTRIAAAAAEGKYEIHCSFSTDRYNRSHFFQLRDFLEKEEGYEVILTNGMKSVEFCINWRDDKKFW